MGAEELDAGSGWLLHADGHARDPHIRQHLLHERSSSLVLETEDDSPTKLCGIQKLC